MHFQALWTDTRYALRQIRHSLWFSSILIVILAVGFGISIAVFSAVGTVLLAPLPYKEPSRLIQIVSWWPKSGEENGWSAPLRDAVDWKASVPAFQDVAMYRYSLMTLGDNGAAESVYGLRVSTNTMPMLGIRPQLGAWFPAEYERPGNNHVVLLSSDLWRRRFHADPKIVGKTIHLDGEDFEVLGVMPRGFNFPLRLGTTAQLPTDQMQFWMPLGLDFAQERHGNVNLLSTNLGYSVCVRTTEGTCNPPQVWATREYVAIQGIQPGAGVLAAAGLIVAGGSRSRRSHAQQSPGCSGEARRFSAAFTGQWLRQFRGVEKSGSTGRNRPPVERDGRRNRLQPGSLFCSIDAAVD